MKLNLRSLSILVFLGVNVCSHVMGQKKNASYEAYIKQYLKLAVQEEQTHRIPTCITLAQALLESNAGQSKLAVQANNHFGIKCHSGWNGESIYANDEKLNECFRKYNRVGDSYRDHSRFLTERAHYAPLFSLKRNDYKGWANGLQRCGYATDREYATKLIRVIETYQLHRFSAKTSGRLHTLYKINQSVCVVAEAGDSFESIAEDVGVRIKKLLNYNEAPPGFLLRKGDVVYLEKKRKKAEKTMLTHQVQSGESMHKISQLYGIRIRNLYELNGKSPDYVPEVGETLKLR